MDVNIIYLPYNIGGCQWVLIVLHIVNVRINVWDLFIDLTLEVDLDKELNNIRCVVLALLHHSCVFTVKPILPPTSWPVCHVRYIPQQMVTGDCGIYCYKFFFVVVYLCGVLREIVMKFQKLFLYIEIM